VICWSLYDSCRGVLLAVASVLRSIAKSLKFEDVVRSILVEQLRSRARSMTSRTRRGRWLSTWILDDGIAQSEYHQEDVDAEVERDAWQLRVADTCRWRDPSFPLPSSRGWGILDAVRRQRPQAGGDLSPTDRQDLIGEGEAVFEEAGPVPISQLRDHVVEARVCELRHPTSRTLVRWLREIGFKEVQLMHNGGDLAGRLYDALPEEQRLTTHPELTAWLEPLVRVVVTLPAPEAMDPMITAVR